MVCCLETFCTECGTVLNSTLSSDRLDNSTAGNVPFVVSRQAVAATLDMGLGHAGLPCRFLDMEPMHHFSYSKHMLAVSEANREVVTRLMEDAAVTIRRAYRDLEPSISEGDVIDLTVSYDGSWMTRGHTSLYGIGCVVDVVTGLVIDLAVLSLHCQRCSYAKKRYGVRTPLNSGTGTRGTATSVTGTTAGLRAEWKLLLRNRCGTGRLSLTSATRRSSQTVMPGRINICAT